MKQFRKKLMVIVCIVMILVGAIFTHQYIARQREATIEQERIARAYLEINLAFEWGGSRGTDWDSLERYRPLEVEHNPFGICVSAYLLLNLYYRETGVRLAYETIADYFSQEFESDGSLRLYNNGKHPEIQTFVEWMRNITIQPITYWLDIRNLYLDYSNTHKDAGFIEHHISKLSPQMLDALVRAEADPNYVLDLTSLQRAGY